ncbi:TatD family hydrolase [Enterobacter cloacae]|uniref:TatD family hydrolase n=1 Tax=Enterobacter cloacae TaxID=550 RepID=UPI003A93759F
MTHRFVDTHCHFDFPPFTGDETQSIERAAQAGIHAMIVPAIEVDRFERVLDLARRHDALYAALGLHPIVIEHHLDEHLDVLDAPLHRHKHIITPPAIVANDPLTVPLVDVPQANDALLDNEDLA